MVDFFLNAAKMGIIGTVMGIGGFALLRVLTWLFDLME